MKLFESLSFFLHAYFARLQHMTYVFEVMKQQQCQAPLLCFSLTFETLPAIQILISWQAYHKNVNVSKTLEFTSAATEIRSLILHRTHSLRVFACG